MECVFSESYFMFLMLFMCVFSFSHPTSGSFVRPKKVDLGQDLVSAIQHRYGVQHDGDAGVDTDKLFVLDSSNRATVVEMVGAEKVNKKQRWVSADTGS